MKQLIQLYMSFATNKRVKKFAGFTPIFMIGFVTLWYILDYFFHYESLDLFFDYYGNYTSTLSSPPTLALVLISVYSVVHKFCDATILAIIGLWLHNILQYFDIAFDLEYYLFYKILLVFIVGLFFVLSLIKLRHAS